MLAVALATFELNRERRLGARPDGRMDDGLLAEEGQAPCRYESARAKSQASDLLAPPLESSSLSFNQFRKEMPSSARSIRYF